MTSLRPQLLKILHHDPNTKKKGKAAKSGELREFQTILYDFGAVVGILAILTVLVPICIAILAQVFEMGKKKEAAAAKSAGDTPTPVIAPCCVQQRAQNAALKEEVQRLRNQLAEVRAALHAANEKVAALEAAASAASSSAASFGSLTLAGTWVTFPAGHCARCACILRTIAVIGLCALHPW